MGGEKIPNIILEQFVSIHYIVGIYSFNATEAR